MTSNAIEYAAGSRPLKTVLLRVVSSTHELLILIARLLNMVKIRNDRAQFSDLTETLCNSTWIAMRETDFMFWSID